MKHYKEILRLGAPILVGQLGMIVVGFADNIMVGRYSTEALASASFVNNLFNVVLFMCIGFTYGLTPLIGALFARGDSPGIGATLRAGVRINLVFSALLTIVMGVLYFYVDRLGQPAELLPLIRPYYLIYLAGIIPVTLFNVFAQWSYACRDTAMPMWIILSANAVNVVGNYILIFGHFGAPELGLTGAGISTLLARVLCPAVIIAVYLLKRSNRRYHRSAAGGDVRRVSGRLIFGKSIPVSMQMAFESGSFTVAALMAGWLGKYELASFQVIVIVGSLGFCVYYSMASAVSVLVANAAGRGDTHTERSVAWQGYHIMLVLAAVASIVFAVSGRHLFGLFSNDPKVIAMTATLIIPLILYQLGDATQITFANALRGTGRVMPMLWIAFTAYIVIGIPASYLLGIASPLGIRGIVYSFSASLFPAGAMFLYYFMDTTRRRMTSLPANT